MKQVTILDVGLGNLRSVARAFERAGTSPMLSSDPDAIRRADRLVLPGQGGFLACATALSAELSGALREFLGSGKRYLGICLGMQILFERSEEAPGAPGLGWFDGEVRRFSGGLTEPGTHARLKVPHMGWNEVQGPTAFFAEPSWFYFVHSYHCVPGNDALVAGRADYGIPFCAAVAKDNVFACQFHPEKSQDAGGRLIAHFLSEAPWS